MAIKEHSESENIYDRIQEIFGSVPEHYSILEEQIDIDLQMEYFEQSKSVKQSLDPPVVMNKKESIYDSTLPLEERKLIFTQLASLEDVEAYRTIERYIKSDELDLKNWAILALQESRMLLESKLLDESQVFISTGLGGKDSKLRYFVVLIGKQQQAFGDLHKKVIRNEFEILLKKYDSELEKIEFKEEFALLMAILPLPVSIRGIFKEAIKNCNIYGDFLKSNFIVTNVRELSLPEIKDFLSKQQQLDEL